MPIGNQSEASEILAAFRAGDAKEMWYSDIPLPDGWKYIGHGRYRCAFLSPTGVVYKVETESRPSRFRNQSNMGEYERILELRFSDAAKGVIIPKAWLYSVGRRNVLAMEYMTGDCPAEYHAIENCDCGDRFGGTCAMTQFMNLEMRLGMTDIHHGNAVFIPAQKRWALIDLGA